jgi:hypothetical protein
MTLLCPPVRRRPLHAALPGLALLLLLALPALGASPPLRDKYAGTYRIEGRQALEQRGMYHFFYLHRSGRFVLAAEWPAHESTRIGGTWRVDGTWIVLQGTAHVRTNQGDWQVPFDRRYRTATQDGGFRLTPLPEKNRYGLLGWPSPFIFDRPTPEPNLPDKALPRDEAALVDLSQTLHPAE